jgi:hypothetical protein
MATLNEASAIVTISHGAVADVYGDYGEFIASALRDYTWAVFMVRPVANHGTQMSFDIAIGAIGVEVPVVTEFTKLTIGSGSDWNDSFVPVGIPIKISTGDRVAVRVKSGDAGFGVDFECQLRLFV